MGRMFINSGLNEEETWDQCASFEGGQFSNARANILQPNQCALLQNMDFTRAGQLVTRRGIKQLGDNLNQVIQGVAFYNTQVKQEMILAAYSIVTGTSILRRFNGIVWSLPDAGYLILSAHTPIIFVQGINNLYIAQTDSVLHYYDGTNLLAYSSVAVQEITLVDTAGVATAPLNGTYFKLRDQNGSVGVWINVGTAAIIPATGCDRDIELTVQASDNQNDVATKIAAALDADAAFTSTSDRSVITITCVQAGARTDAIDVTTGFAVSVSQQGRDVNQLPPVGPGAMIWHTDRLILSAVSTAPDTVYFSQFLDTSLWDRTNWTIRVGAGDGEKVTGLIGWTNYNMIVFKEHSIWNVNCNPINPVTSFVINRVHNSIGCLAPRTACQVGTDIFFLSDSGVRSIKNIIASEQQREVGQALSYPIENVLQRINVSAISTACAYHWNNRYILAIPVDGAVTPNLVVVYNTLTESWSGEWTQWKPMYFAQRLDAGVPKLWFGQSDGTTCEWMDYVPPSQETDLAFKDQGIDIPSKIITRAMTWNEPICPKTGLNARFEFNQSKADVSVKVIRDDSSAEACAAFSTLQNSLTLPLILPFVLPKAGVVRTSVDLMHYQEFTELQFQIDSSKSKLALRNITASAWPNTVLLQSAQTLLQSG